MHYNRHTKQEQVTENYLPAATPVSILVTSGASCPDALVEGVIRKLAGYYGVEERIDELTEQFRNSV